MDFIADLVAKAILWARKLGWDCALAVSAIIDAIFDVGSDLGQV